MSEPFTCNICGARNRAPAAGDREASTCTGCRSSSRMRSVVLALSRALFGLDLPLTLFPRLASVRGIGISDSEIYAGHLERCFDYTNTFYHREPKLDLVNPDEREFGRYDFAICSEVLEHVPPPVERAFDTLARLLKPAGQLILTLPYSVEPETEEHFADLESSTLAAVNGKTVLVGALAGGGYRVFDNLVFHGGSGATLERRVFCESDLRAHLASAGFTGVRFEEKGSPKFGVEFEDQWSLPVIASRQPFALTGSAASEFAAQYAVLLDAARTSLWMRLGRRLGLGPKLAAIASGTLDAGSRP